MSISVTSHQSRFFGRPKVPGLPQNDSYVWLVPLVSALQVNLIAQRPAGEPAVQIIEQQFRLPIPQKLADRADVRRDEHVVERP